MFQSEQDYLFLAKLAPGLLVPLHVFQLSLSKILSRNCIKFNINKLYYRLPLPSVNDKINKKEKKREKERRRIMIYLC